MKAIFDWNLTDFSSRYRQRRGITSLRGPYPSSPSFTTEYGSVTAIWKIRLNSDSVEGHDTNREWWEFRLDLLDTEINRNGEEEDNASPPPPKRGICIDPGVKIYVKCQLYLAQDRGYPIEDENERFESTNSDSTTATEFKFSSKYSSAKLGWPYYFRGDQESDDEEEMGEGSEGKEIARNRRNWVNSREDVLRVRVTLKFIEVKIAPPPLDSLTSKLLSDFGATFDSGQGSDVTINYGPNSFPVHKYILCGRSPVFRVMLTADMNEAATGVITIRDTDPQVLKQLLDFMYTARVHLGSLEHDQILGLIAMADKYQVVDLKDFCFQHLLNKLNGKTCGKLAVAAYLHGATLAQKNAIYKYNAERWVSLGADRVFQALVKAHPAASLKELENDGDDDDDDREPQPKKRKLPTPTR